MVWWFFSLCFLVIFLYFWSCKANQLWRWKIINVVKKLSMCISKYWHHLTVVVVLRSPSLYSFTTTSFSSSTLIYSPKAKPVLQMVPVEWCSLVIVSLVWLVGWFALRRGRDGWLRWIEFVRDKEEFVEASLKASKNLFSSSRWVQSIPLLSLVFQFLSSASDLPFPWEETIAYSMVYGTHHIESVHTNPFSSPVHTLD